MDSNNNNSFGNFTNGDDAPWMSLLERKIKFFLLLSFQIPSFSCTLFILYHLQWRHVQTQIYGFLLIANALIVGVELSITLYFLHEGTIYLESRCSAWITLNYTLFQLSIFLMTWTSIQRYMFIYHEQFISRHMILFHYGPIIFLYIYCPLLYVGMVVLHDCKPAYDVTVYICGGPCYSTELGLGLFDWVGNGISMELTTLIVNVVVTVRHFMHRYRMKRSALTAVGRQQWHRSVKLAIQLISIGMIYVIGWVPYSLLVLVQMFGSSEMSANILSRYFVYLPYFQELLIPFVCILFMPDAKTKLAALFLFPCRKLSRYQNNRVHATVHITMASKMPSRTAAHGDH